MSFQLQTQSIKAYPDFYDNQKSGKRSFSVTIMQPVSVSLDFSPMKGGDIKQMQDALSAAKDAGKEVSLDYQTSIDNFGKQKFVVYSVSSVTSNVK